jgi:hypothetical protein
VVAGSMYNFAPVATDANNDPLGFSVTNKPAWAAFSTATGALTGTPATAQIGSYTNIVISVSDGKVSQSLPSFAITVTQPTPPPPTTGTATLSWIPPTQNTDGSALTNLAGFRIYHGTSPNALTDVVQVPGAGSAGYTYSPLASGTHYFAITAYTTNGTESAKSTVGSKTIP